MGDKSPSSGASGVEGRGKDTPVVEPARNVTVNYNNMQARQVVFNVFGRELNDQEIGMLVGAQEGATVFVENDGDKIHIVTTHQHIEEQSRYISKAFSGEISTYNSYFRTNRSAPPGFGTKVFTDQVNGSRALGVKIINVSAAGSLYGSMNGYYTWPRMGYDGPIYESILNRIPAPIRKTMNGGTKIQDLYRTKEGRDWWKENGSGLELSFNTDPRSPSSRVLDAYNEERAKRKKG